MPAELPVFRDSLPPPIRSVFHPTDLSPKSARAFLHALKIALIRGTRLEIMHLGGKTTSWHDFPAVRATLERWGVLAPGSERNAVLLQTGIDVTKVASKRRRSVSSLVSYLRAHPSEMIVLATSGRQGLAQLLRPSFGERLVRRAATGALFVTDGARGFVDEADGSIRLRSVLAMVDRQDAAQRIVDMVARLVATVGTEPERLLLVHTVPVEARLPGGDRWPWQLHTAKVPAVDEVGALARANQVDLIVTAAPRRRSLSERLFGSATERIVRQAICPVLMLPPE